MLTRREVLAIAAGGFSSVARAAGEIPLHNGIPAVDFHVHIGEELSVDRAIGISRAKKLKFGLLQHAGGPRGDYAVRDDGSLLAWVQSLEGKPVFKAIEAETTNWAALFSKSALARLDYVQADALGIPDQSGAPMQIWKPDFQPANPAGFMDRYLDFQLQRIAEPIDIFVVPTFLPASMLADYDRWWNPRRVQALLDALLKHDVALEIDGRFRVPRFSVLESAKQAGVKFAFGSNYQNPESVGDISYCIQMYRRLHLTAKDFFRPMGAGRRL